MPFQTATEWANSFKTKHVQADVFIGGQNFVSAESIALCARVWDSTSTEAPELRFEGDEFGGPTSLGKIGDFVAIGLVQNVNIQQNKNIQQLFEIGSKLPYFIPGRTVVQANIGRILLNGDSLMKMLYPAEDAVTASDNKITDTEKRQEDYDGGLGTKPGGGMASIAGKPRTNQFFINLASGFFNLPLDLMMLIMDSEKDPVGGVILGQCYIQSHQMAVQAQQTVVAENITLRCAQLHPLSAS